MAFAPIPLFLGSTWKLAFTQAYCGFLGDCGGGQALLPHEVLLVSQETLQRLRAFNSWMDSQVFPSIFSHTLSLRELCVL